VKQFLSVECGEVETGGSRVEEGIVDTSRIQKEILGHKGSWVGTHGSIGLADLVGRDRP
jgi:hypothetical protein